MVALEGSQSREARVVINQVEIKWWTQVHSEWLVVSQQVGSERDCLVYVFPEPTVYAVRCTPTALEVFVSLVIRYISYTPESRRLY